MSVEFIFEISMNSISLQLDAFSCPKLLEETKSLNDQLVEEKTHTGNYGGLTIPG